MDERLKKIILDSLKLSIVLFLTSACGGGGSSSENNDQEIVEYQYQQPIQITDGWPVADLHDSSFNVSRIESFITSVSNGDYPEIDGVLLVQSGAIVLEEYFNGYSRAQLHETQSMIKSFDSAVIGILKDQNRIQSLHQPIIDYLADVGNVDWSGMKSDITLADLMTMRSGLDCLENNASGCNSTNINQSQNWATYTLSQQMATTPGEVFSYFSGLNLVAHRIVENVTGELFDSFIDQHLMRPLGITTYRYDQSPTGEELNAYLRPRDMAKFGQLFLNKGSWNGQQILSSQWVEESTKIQVSEGQWLEKFNYGYWWWLFDGQKAGKSFNFIGASGANGQWIILMPERDIVIVITGNRDNDLVFDIIDDYLL